jgi:hypothetical protein
MSCAHESDSRGHGISSGANRNKLRFNTQGLPAKKPCNILHPLSQAGNGHALTFSGTTLYVDTPVIGLELGG